MTPIKTAAETDHECSEDGPCDPFGWCSKHEPVLPPEKDLCHEYARELLPPEVVVFLDFDGVIRVASQGGWVEAGAVSFCPGRMRMLRQACIIAGARIVVSSDWRNLENRLEIEGHLQPDLAGLLHDDWATPITGHRWNEVQRWLNVHPEVKRYAILEDFAMHFEGCPAEMAARLVMCNNRFGLVPELIPRLMDALTL